jgi:hypothetical protein
MVRHLHAVGHPVPGRARNFAEYFGTVVENQGVFDRTLVALVTRLDPSRANRPVLPDAVALTH